MTKFMYNMPNLRYHHLCLDSILLVLILITNFSVSDSSTENLDVEKENQRCDPIICPTSKNDFKSLPNKQHLIKLMDIESNESRIKRVLSKENNKLFFIESSGRNYLTPRDACAIESAVKNSGLDGYIIFAMTSPSLNILANNVTCHIYHKYSGHAVYFLHVNVDSFFKGTPIQHLHEKGLLKHEEEINTIVQYR